MANEPMKLSFSQGIHEVSSSAKERLGRLRILDDGRKFRYCKNGGILLDVGKPVETPAVTADHIDATVAVDVPIGKMVVHVTVAGTLVSENQYKEGWLQVNSGTGEGHQYRIGSNTACVLSGTTIVTLDEPIKVALEAGVSKVSLIMNLWKEVIVSTAATMHPAGVPIVAVPVDYYFWSQTGGEGCALVANAIAAGTVLANGAATLAAQSAFTDHAVAIMGPTAGVTSNYKPVKWIID